MAEEFSLNIIKVCPGCSQNCPRFEPKIVTVFDRKPIQGGTSPLEPFNFIVVERRRIACANEDLCFTCWKQSVSNLLNAGQKTEFRTVWGKKEYRLNGNRSQV